MTLQIQQLHKTFSIPGKHLLARSDQARVLNGVDLQVNSGEVVGIVGESGCGKSTLARVVMNIEVPTQGRVVYCGKEIRQWKPRELYGRLQMVFQDPFSSLNPKLRICRILGELIRLHQPGVNVYSEMQRVLEEVGLPVSAKDKYPHEFSGGQRQRIAIARALAVRPEFIIADEPVSALDVSIQAQILNLLNQLRRERNLGILLISHDLNVVEYFCDRVMVMYLGRFVEVLQGKGFSERAVHPYTRALLNSAPAYEKRKAGIQQLTGETPSPLNLPEGCAFFARCPMAKESCQQAHPPLSGEHDHQFACYEVG